MWAPEMLKFTCEIYRSNLFFLFYRNLGLTPCFLRYFVFICRIVQYDTECQILI